MFNRTFGWKQRLRSNKGSEGVLVKQEPSESRGNFSPAGCQIHPEDTQSGQIILIRKETNAVKAS